jgi:hypothetical protein
MCFLTDLTTGIRMKSASGQQGLRHLLLIAACILSTANASADIVTYVVDPARSSLTISGTNNGDPLQPQTGVPTALTTSYSGAIEAVRNAGTIEINNSTITAQTASATSIVGNSPADYGFYSPSASDSYWGDIVDLSFLLSSTTIASPSSFDSALLSFGVSSGTIEYGILRRLPPATPSTSYQMAGPLVLQHGFATLQDDGGIETLTLPIDTDFMIELPYPPAGTTNLIAMHFSGEIVATSPVPEPGFSVLLGVPALSLFSRRVYKDRSTR